MRDSVEESSQPHEPAEPSEEELREMLEAREKDQDSNWKKLNRLSTRILLGCVAIVGIGLAASPSWRDLIVTLFKEGPKDFQDSSPSRTTPKAGAPDEEMMKQAAALASKASGGKLIDKGDIEFGMELMNFMHSPAGKDPAAEKARKAAAEKEVKKEE